MMDHFDEFGAFERVNVLYLFIDYLVVAIGVQCLIHIINIEFVGRIKPL